MHVSDDLWNVITNAQYFSEKSWGAFRYYGGAGGESLGVGARRTKQLPDPVKLARARKAVGYRNVRLMYSNDHTVKLLVPDMRLDVGGIGKGYALDAALKVLKQTG